MRCGSLNQTPAPASGMAGSSSCTMLRRRRLTTTASFPSRSPHHQRGVLPTGFLCIRFNGRWRSCFTEAGAQSTRAPTSKAAAGYPRNSPRPADCFPHSYRKADDWVSRRAITPTLAEHSVSASQPAEAPSLPPRASVTGLTSPHPSPTEQPAGSVEATAPQSQFVAPSAQSAFVDTG